MPEKQALNSQKGLFYPVSQQSLNEITDIFLCVCKVFRGKFRNDVLRGTFYYFLTSNSGYLSRMAYVLTFCRHLCLHNWPISGAVKAQLIAQVIYLLLCDLTK